MVFFSRKIAHRERAEAERDKLLTKEREARADAERAGRVKDEFLATLSHELRTPLRSILGWRSIRRGTLAEQADLPRVLATIQRNAEAQARLVDDLLDAVRIQAGTLQLDFAPVNLQAPVPSALDAVRPAAEAKRVAVELHPPASLVVSGDAGRLPQVASNLLVNAITVTLPIAAARVDGVIHGSVAAATQLAPDVLLGVRILVVEDDPDVRGVVARLLEKVGAAVAVLPSGDGLTTELREFRPDLLLIDIGLPCADTPDARPLGVVRR